MTLTSKHAAIIREYSDTFRPVEEIAAQFSITAAGLYRILTRNGIPRRAERGIRLRRTEHRSTPRVFPVVSTMHAATGDLIGRRRRTAGGQLDEFARHLGVTKTILRRIEAGTYDPPLSQILAICDKLGLTFEQLAATAASQAKRFQNAV